MPQKISRRAFFAATSSSVALSAVRFTSRQPVVGRKPTIIFVFSDEHRYHSMSFTEMPHLRTPVMERMAKEGFCFTHCISNYPVCSPYRAMLMTGRWPYQTGVLDNDIALRDTEYTIADAFKAAGYRTAYIGKWHLGGTRAEPFGFDVSLIWTGTNTHYNHSQYHPLNESPVRPNGYNATLMTDQAIAYITNADDSPYLLMLSLNPPHSCFTDAPPEKRALYPDGSLPWRPNVHRGTGDGNTIVDKNGSPYYEGYHGHISAVDDELGRILLAVSRSKSGANTIVIYTSDHGSQFGSQGVGGKRQPFEESIRVPFLIWTPGDLFRRGHSNALLGAQDIMPTLCGLAGVSIPETCSGQDFSSHLINGYGPEPEAQLLMHIAKDNASGGRAHPAPLFRGIRTQRYTYTVTEHGPLHLFDNWDDPYQLQNRINDSGYKGLCGMLHQKLKELLVQAEDPFPV